VPVIMSVDKQRTGHLAGHLPECEVQGEQTRAAGQVYRSVCAENLHGQRAQQWEVAQRLRAAICASITAVNT